MEGNSREYRGAFLHNVTQSNKCECDNMENMETYSEEVEIGKKKVKITLEFPYTVDPKDAVRFEHMLKEIYWNRFKKRYVQSDLNAVSFPTPKGKGGMNHE